MSSKEDDSERRASARRWVMMRVQVADQQTVQFANTVNISNTGVLIERVPGLELVLDQYVNVVVEGMLADDSAEEDEGEGRLMMVVRQTDEHIALTFLD